MHALAMYVRTEEHVLSGPMLLALPALVLMATLVKGVMPTSTNVWTLCDAISFALTTQDRMSVVHTDLQERTAPRMWTNAACNRSLALATVSVPTLSVATRALVTKTTMTPSFARRVFPAKNQPVDQPID